MCPNSKCNCWKQITFDIRQFQLNGSGFKNKLKCLKGTEKAWNKFLKPAVYVAAPFIGMAVGAKTKNLKVAPATTNNSNSISVERCYLWPTCTVIDSD